MRIHATLNERTVRRTFRERKIGRNGLTVIDNDLPAFALKVAKNGPRTFIVHVSRKLRRDTIVLGKANEITVAEAREKAAAVIAEATTEGEAGPQFADFAQDFMRRQGRRWKPSTRKGNAHLIDRYLLPFFRAMRVREIDRTDVRRWFDSLSGTPGNANRTLPVLSVMMRQAELWDIRPQGSNPCRNMRRYKMPPRERFLSLEELKRLGFVLDHAEDEQAAAAIRLLMLTGARLSEILNLTWNEIGEIGEDGASVRIEDSKTGPRTLWLGPEAANVLAGLPQAEDATRVFPESLTPNRLYTFWVRIRDEAGMPGLRIHDCRHTWASQGIMNGVGLTTVGRLLGHRQRETTAIYAHLDDVALRDTAKQVAAVIARAMGFSAQPSLAETQATAANGTHHQPKAPGKRTTPGNRTEEINSAKQPRTQYAEEPISIGKESGQRLKTDWL